MVSFDCGYSAVFPVARKTEIVGRLAAHMDVTEMVIEQLRCLGNLVTALPAALEWTLEVLAAPLSVCFL